MGIIAAYWKHIHVYITMGQLTVGFLYAQLHMAILPTITMPKLIGYSLCVLAFLNYAPFARAQPFASTGFCEIPNTPTYTMWLHGPEEQQAYEHALVDFLLKKTSPTNGPYTLKTFNRDLNFKRERMEYQRANEYHIHIAPSYSVLDTQRHKFMRLEQPIAQGVAGYRRLVVRRDDVTLFSRIHSVSHLQTLVAGVGLGWPESTILQQNKLPAMESVDLRSLFAMLEKYRFDYIPLSTQAIEPTLKAMSTDFPNLVMEPNIVLYYPMALYLHVCADDKALVERLRVGLQQAKLDGSFHHLFNQHFGNLVGQLQQPNIRLFTLQNESISADGIQHSPVLITLPASARYPALQ